jgi:hypothetical protein
LYLNANKALISVAPVALITVSRINYQVVIFHGAYGEITNRSLDIT